SLLNTTGSSGQGEPACIFFGSANIDLDEWFLWTANGTGTATLSTCGSAPVDTKIAVWDGSACPPTINIGCNDDSCGLQSGISFSCVACTQYLVQVGVFPGSAGGAGTLTITGPAGSGGPPNDNCASATNVGDGTHNYDLTCATNDWAGTCGATGAAEDVWYRYTASCSGTANVSTCGLTAGDSVLTILDECVGPQVLCLDDSCGLQTSVFFSVAAGEDYYIRIAQFSGGQHSGQFSVSCSSSTTNDDCAGATPISEFCWYEYDNSAANTDGAPDPACLAFSTPQIDHDLWYILEGNCAGTIVLETCGGSDLDTKIAVFDNGMSNVPTCPTGPAIACNDDFCGLQSNIEFVPTAGHFYMIRIGNFPGSAGGPGAFRVGCGSCNTIGCQPGTREENEACGADTDGGCNAGVPGAYELVTCSE
ncbi:MAG: hypothetical protein H7210_08685, partial [Pyrinomonadaceae bacterium]|nr:hypothetical protein [Phycisphaerales bacterium]